MNRREYLENMKMLLTEWHGVGADIKFILEACKRFVYLIVAIAIRLVLIAFLPITALIPMRQSAEAREEQLARMRRNHFRNGNDLE